jgi:hypothetical protein
MHESKGLVLIGIQGLKRIYEAILAKQLPKSSVGDLVSFGSCNRQNAVLDTVVVIFPGIFLFKGLGALQNRVAKVNFGCGVAGHSTYFPDLLV